MGLRSTLFLFRLLLCMVCVLSLPARGGAAPTYHPGFKTLGMWLADTGERLDIAFWYPSIRSPSQVQYGDWTLTVARNGKEIPGRYPLVILSHGSAGSRFTHHDTAASLAASGFVVAAPTHPGDNIDDTSALFAASQLTSRPKHISTLLDHLLGNTDTLQLIDPSRIAVVGYGVGGTMALLLGGAQIDSASWKGYCEKSGPTDTYCTPWARERMDLLAQQTKNLPSFKDNRVRAVAAIAPSYGMLFTKGSLASLTAPTLLVKAGLDEVNRAPLHADWLRTIMPSAPEFSVLAEADHFALIAQCPPTLERDLPEICGAVPPRERDDIHRRLHASLLRFLLAHLGESNPADVPPLPAPPVRVTAPATPQANATAANATTTNSTGKAKPKQNRKAQQTR